MCPPTTALAVWEAIYAAGQAHGITEYGTETMHVLRAEKGYIIVGQDTDGTVTPDDAGLSWAIGKNKTDFVGKRSLRARLDEGRGSQATRRPAHPRRRASCSRKARRLRPRPGQTPPMQLIGHVTSSYYSSVLGLSDRARAGRRRPRAAGPDAVRAHAGRRHRSRSHLAGFLRSHGSTHQWLRPRCAAHRHVPATGWLKALPPAPRLVLHGDARARALAAPLWGVGFSERPAARS